MLEVMRKELKCRGHHIIYFLPPQSFIFSRSLFSLTATSSAAASNDDSTDVVFVKVLMNFPVCVRGRDGYAKQVG
jgi:hypothetical protein